jgi:hypothetical protein
LIPEDLAKNLFSSSVKIEQDKDGNAKITVHVYAGDMDEKRLEECRNKAVTTYEDIREDLRQKSLSRL